MAKTNRLTAQHIWGGCGLLVLLFGIGLAAASLMFINRSREAVRYPETVLIADHSVYTPTFVFWNYEYRSADSLDKIVNWYIAELGLNTLDRWVGPDCLLLNGLDEQFTVEHELGVMICETASGQTIYVTRSIAIRSLRDGDSRSSPDSMDEGYY